MTKPRGGTPPMGGDAFLTSLHFRCTAAYLVHLRAAMAVDGATNRTGWIRRVLAEAISQRTGVPYTEIMAGMPEGSADTRYPRKGHILSG
jgi:hypothetical protein